MSFERVAFAGLMLAASSMLLASCSSFTDCKTRHDCPADTGSHGGVAGTSGFGAAGVSGASGKGGGSSSSAGTSGDGGADSSAGSGGAAPPTCDGTLSPDVDACVISDEFGVFVSPTGIDASADGTQAHPYATVTAALAKISKIKHVYVCVGDSDYSEPDTLQIPDRVSIYGGFTCAGGTWKYDSATPAHLISARPIGAMITNAKVGVVLQDLRIDAANAPEDGTGANSFGLMISGSQGVALKRVEIRAGKGGKGKSGADGATGLDGVASGSEQNGAAGSCANPSTLADGPHPVAKQQCGSEGGNGGAARVGKDYAASQDGGSAYLVSPTNGGKGGELLGKNADPGKNGDNGARGDIGTNAAAVGTFSTNGYKVASGGSGSLGKPGQGGGGGGASLGGVSCLGATGGAGGMGGCGGDPGMGGTGGGASVALLSWQSLVSIDACKLVASNGGAGGDGGKGRVGGAGKAGGTGGAADATNTVGKGGNGGDGGNGGNGGNGAGGTGGPSIALVYDATPVTQVSPSTLIFAPTPSAGGKGGALGQPEAYGPDGSKGLTQDIFPKL